MQNNDNGDKKNVFFLDYIIDLQYENAINTSFFNFKVLKQISLTS
jgi:hypothetical protein